MGFFIRFLSKYILQKILKEQYSDMRLMEAMVEGSNLNLTIVRPSRLTNKLLKGNYRIAINSHLRKPLNIAWIDLAHYLISSIENPQSFKVKVEISY